MQAHCCGLFVILTIISSGHSYDLTDVSSAVFGDGDHNVAFLPAAFGDFNSDKLTDFIVFDSQKKHVGVLLASEQSVVATESSPIFRGNQKSLNCSCPNDCYFVSSAPGDFDGDGSMDLMSVTVKDGVKNIFIMWGTSDGYKASLECNPSVPVDIKDVGSEPLVFDFNGDQISDLLTVDKDGNRTVFVFDAKRSYTTRYLDTERKDQLKAEDGNAFVDINADGRADLVLTSKSGLELYQGVKTEPWFTHLCTVPWPELEGCDVDQCVGQPVFFDFSLSGSLDMLLPVCTDPKCDQSQMYLIPVTELAACHMAAYNWTSMSLELGQGSEAVKFMPRDPTKSPLQLLSPRVGDVDLDGYPDVLMTVCNKSSDCSKGEVMLLLNVPCEPLSGCHPVWRQLQVQPSYTRGVGPAITAAFFDLYEDGKMDLIVINKDSLDNYKLSAYVNTTQDSDAYFMKVIVLTGKCYHNCDRHNSDYVPYGTNAGGQLVSYISQRPGQETFSSYKSVAVQLPQTSHFALGLPYTIFGLGMAPNFVDYLAVNISGMSHDWPQIIPNSQLYVIPYPYSNPSGWDLKLIITTSKNIVITGLALVGTCALCSVIIVMLHIRQKRQDRQAKLQEGSRFHFDAL